MFFQVIGVFLLALLEIWLAIPAGLIWGLNPALVILLVCGGTLSGVGVILLLSGKIRAGSNRWLDKNRTGDAALSLSALFAQIIISLQERLRSGRLYKVWLKYGIIGLGLLSPVLTSAPIAAFLGVMLNAGRLKLFVWIAIGVAVWAAGLTLAMHFGLILLGI
ncbi:small multi-drug export protein [Dehalococcoides mccartyi]|uniref:small multi-drug export protein n=1 Tax=Dehalococcoides mccartyi TaxID=61435 RepID=UPI001A03B282|nr:small multi-drug export protein [Dehalococcoides mccartyi]MBF4482780.1 small multi-drug export protein [Dehalococcoides mccartyi]MBJ7532221.1 small multi-drug export protein [Dehalococcoides mccartyi]